MRRRRPFYLQLYLALLASALVCLGGVAIAYRFLREPVGPPGARMRQAAAALADEPPDPRLPDAQRRLDALADDLAVDLLVGGPPAEAGGGGGGRGTVLLASGSKRPFPPPGRPGPRWRPGGPGPPLLVIDLPDDRWAAIRPRGMRPPWRPHPFFSALVVLAVVMAVGSYPVARRVSRRLESLTNGVARWGRGELGHRVAADGDDEVATLAATFNQAAERLNLVLDQQRQMLANASHELRSPLARLRMGVELIAEEDDPARRQKQVEEIRRDIVELDGLIEEILLFARADGRVPRRPPEPVDLLALAREEAARTGASVETAAGDGAGEAVVLTGDPVMLRHLVRNLLENAQRHAGGQGVRARVTADADETPGQRRVTLVVEDEGPGIPADESARIFAPFYRRPGTAPGHGLGLALVRQVARYHGGDVTFAPRPGGGSRFEVTLPAQSAGR